MITQKRQNKKLKSRTPDQRIVQVYSKRLSDGVAKSQDWHFLSFGWMR
jgi:ribosomal protein L34E